MLLETLLLNGLTSPLSIMYILIQKQPLEVLSKKGVLKNFAKFTGKQMCQSLFFNKVAGLIMIKKDSGTRVFL